MTIRRSFISLALSAAILAAMAGYSYAQQPVAIQPLQVTTQNGSTTITTTNTFQSIFAASTATRGRAACTVQNNGTHNMFVFFGDIASALTPTAVQLTPAQSVNCASGPVVLKDQVSITGTAGEQFYAGQQ